MPFVVTNGPVTDDTLTIRPYRRSIIPGKTARIIRNAVCNVISICRRQSA